MSMKAKLLILLFVPITLVMVIYMSFFFVGQKLIKDLTDKYINSMGVTTELNEIKTDFTKLYSVASTWKLENSSTLMAKQVLPPEFNKLSAKLHTNISELIKAIKGKKQKEHLSQLKENLERIVSAMYFGNLPYYNYQFSGNKFPPLPDLLAPIKPVEQWVTERQLQHTHELNFFQRNFKNWMFIVFAAVAFITLLISTKVISKWLDVLSSTVQNISKEMSLFVKTCTGIQFRSNSLLKEMNSPKKVNHSGLKALRSLGQSNKEAYEITDLLLKEGATDQFFEEMADLSIKIESQSREAEVQTAGASRNDTSPVPGLAEIKEKSFQLKVLSLNANIEAAKMGESGKGFERLASQIADMALEIHDRVDHVEEGPVKKSPKVTVDNSKTIDLVNEMKVKLQDFYSLLENKEKGIESLHFGLQQMNGNIRNIITEIQTGSRPSTESAELLNENLEEANFLLKHFTRVEEKVKILQDVSLGVDKEKKTKPDVKNVVDIDEKRSPYAPPLEEIKDDNDKTGTDS